MSEVTRWRTTNAATNSDALVVYAVEHDSIVAELKAEVIKLNSKLGFLIGVLEGIVVYANDSDMRREFARKALEKLEQQGDGT